VDTKGTGGVDGEQTIKITEESHAKLQALATLTKQTKSELASSLLQAAINDALEAMPESNMPVQEGDDIILADGVTWRGVAKYIAEDIYEKFLRTKEETLRTKKNKGGEDTSADVSGQSTKNLIGRGKKPEPKRRQVIYVPEINSDTFLLFFSKGETGNSYSLRDYLPDGSVQTTYGKKYPYTAQEILEKAKYKFDAPTHPNDDQRFWRELITARNKEHNISRE
jgi:hypothetical protein